MSAAQECQTKVPLKRVPEECGPRVLNSVWRCVFAYMCEFGFVVAFLPDGRGKGFDDKLIVKEC